MLYPMVRQLAFIHSKKNIGIITYIFFTLTSTINFGII